MYTRRNFFQKCLQSFGIIVGWNGVESCTYDSIPPFLQIVFPKPNEIVFDRNNYQIKWEERFVKEIDIELSTDGGKSWKSLATSVDANQRSFDWEVRENSSTECLIRIIDTSKPDINSQTEAFFSILKGMEIDLQLHPALSTIGSLKTFSSSFVEQIAVKRISESEFMALDLTCPHAGCIVEWDSRGRSFICPCHGSKFDQNGCLLIGPSDSPLDGVATLYDTSQQKLIIIFKWITNPLC